MTCYEEVFFFQEDAAHPYVELLEKTETLEQERAFIKELLNQFWYHGQHLIVLEDPVGPRDERYTLDLGDGMRAILHVNEALPYIGLVVEHNKKTKEGT